MKPVVILAKLQILTEDRNAAIRYFQQMSPYLRQVEGFGGVGLWQNVRDPEEHLATYHYSNETSADAGLEAVASRKLLTEATTHSTTPPDVIRMEVQGVHGQPASRAELGQYLSLSIRLAGKGFGDDLMDEIDRILSELHLLGGFLGGEFGRSDTLEETIIGLATWESEAAFMKSVPVGTIYDVRLYRRIQ